jgi:tetratricopeptide (TPR) repeat protein
VGQIINFGRDEEEHWSPAADLAGLLQILLEEVNSGKWLATTLPADEGETPLPWFGEPEDHFFNALHKHWRKRMPRTGKDALADAKAAAKAGEPSQALTLAAEARSLGLTTAQVYTVEARALEDLRRFDDAEASWRQAHELDARSGNSSWPRLLNLVHNLGRYAEAEQLLGPELKLFPNSSRLWRLLGLVIGYHQGRVEEALTACEKACNVVTRGVEDFGQYAWTLGAAGRSSDAVAQAKEALGSGADGALVVKLTFYLYALADEAERSEQLAELRELFLEKEKAGDWNFQPIIETATRNGHPEAAWLAPLAAVANGADVSTLAQWQAWNGA